MIANAPINIRAEHGFYGNVVINQNKQLWITTRK